VRNQKTVTYQIILDVQRSYLQYRQSCSELEVLQSQVRPEVDGAVRRAQAAYREGNVPIFIVLETTRQRLDTDLREAVLSGDVRRFWAELERSVGRRLIPQASPVPTSPGSTASESDPPMLPAHMFNVEEVVEPEFAEEQRLP
jgi:outer membrane protein TolC